MAWSIVGVGTAAETTTTALTLNEPAGCQAGDLLVACISMRSTNTSPPQSPGDWPSSPVAYAGVCNTSTNTSAMSLGIMYAMVRGASAAGSAFFVPVAPSVARGQIVAYRGGQSAYTGIVDGSTAVQTATNTTAVSVAGFTTAVADDLIVGMTSGGQEAAWSAFKSANTPSTASGTTNTSSAPSTTTWTERADTNTTTGADTSLAIFDAVKTATGATGNFTATASIAAAQVVVAAAFKIAPPPTADAWNYQDKTANVTLSNNDKTATTSGTSPFVARSTKLQANGTAGKYYSELLIGSSPDTNYRFGIVDYNASISSPLALSNYYQPNAGAARTYGNVVASGTLPTGVVNDVICMAWDAGAERIWFRVNGGDWNGSSSNNPATGVGGFDTSATPSINQGLYFYSAATAMVATIRTKIAEFSYAAPSGFASWMGEAVDAWSITDLTAGISLTNSSRTATSTTFPTGIRSHTKVLAGSGKYYCEFVIENSTDWSRFGFIDAASSLTSTGAGAFYIERGGDINANGSYTGSTIGGQAAAGVYSMAWDAGLKKGWFRWENGNWQNNASNDPATGAFGADLSFVTNTNQALWFSSFSVAGAGITVRTKLSQFTKTIPSGYSSWMGEPSSLPNVATPTGLSVTASVGPANVAQIYVGLTAGVTVGVVGSGGSLPTGWLAETTPNVTLTVVSGRTVDDGVECFDLQMDATTGTAGSYCLLFYPKGWGAGMAQASRGNTFKAGAYLKKLATSGPGISGQQVQVIEGGSGYTYINDYGNSAAIPTAGAFQASYRELNHTILDGAVAYVSGGIHISINVTAGATSLTFRIAAKLEGSVSINAITQSVGVGTAGIGGPQFVFGSLVPENNANFATEFGTKVSFAKAGRITHIRYWRDPANPGTARTTRLWLMSSEVQLAAAAGANDGSITGWVNGDPLNYDVTAGVQYVVSVNVPSHYSWTDFSYSFVNGDVTALTGMYHPGSAGNYPTNALSYCLFVEPVFRAFSDEETVFTAFGAIVNVTGQSVTASTGGAGAAAITGDVYFPIGGDPDDGTWTEQISGSGDGWNATDNNDIFFGTTPGYYYKPGWRFPSVVIPKDSNILSATLYNIQTGTMSGGDVGYFYGTAVDNLAVWNATTNSPQTVARTTASTLVAMSGGPAVDVKTIVQEIVNRAGWVRGNALGIVGWPDGIATGTTYMTLNDFHTGDSHGRLRVVWQQPPVSISINAATNLITASVGNETILLPVAVNVTGQTVTVKGTGVGSTTPFHAGQNNSNWLSSTQLTLNMGGETTGDLFIASVAYKWNSSGGGVTITPPAGWTLFIGPSYSNNADSDGLTYLRWAVYYKKVDTSVDPAGTGYVWGFSSPVVRGGSMALVRNAHANPIDGKSVMVTSNIGSSSYAVGFKTIRHPNELVYMAFVDFNQASGAGREPPSGYTEPVDVPAYFCYKSVTSVGQVFDATATNANTASQPWIASMFSIAPSAVDVITNVSINAATNLLTTSVGDETVSAPISVNVTGNQVGTSVGTVLTPTVVPVTTNLIATSVGNETVSLPKQVNAATNLITVSDNVVTVTMRTDISTNLTGQSVVASVGLEGAGSTPKPDAWDWTTAMPIGMNLTNDDMTVGG